MKFTPKSASWSALLLGVSASALCIPSAARAQSENEERLQGDSRDEAGENVIIVTASRRETDLKDTPISITAFASEDLEARSLVDLSEISSFAPNLTFNSATEPGGANSAQIFIRGVGQQDYIITADPGVGIYLDGVYLGRAAGGVLDLNDVARVEVLRGPQGTLFGRNTVGGAVNVVTKPIDNEGGEIGITLGQDNRVEISGSAAIRPTDTIGARFSARYLSRDGFGESETTGQEFGDDSSFTMLGKVQWEPSENWSVTITADYRTEDKNPAFSFVTGADPIEFATVPGPGGAAIAPPGIFIPVGFNQIVRPQLAPNLPNIESVADLQTANSSTNGSNVEGFSESETFGISSIIEFQTDSDITFKSITSYRSLDLAFAADNDATPYDISEIDADINQSQFSQELQAYGDTGGISWILGAFYFDENAQDNSENRVFKDRFVALSNSPINIIGLPCTIAPIPGPPGCAGNPANFGLDTNLRTESEIDIENFALFGHLDIKLTDILSLEAGLRWSKETKQFTTSLTRLASGLAAVPLTTVEDSWSSFTPKFGVHLRPDDDTLIFASFSKGFKSGTFNGRSLSQGAVQPVEPEELDAYEVGAKTSFGDGRVFVSLTGFYNDYKGVQLQFVEAGPGGVAVQFDNAGDAEIYGAELEITARPTPNLNIGFTGGWISSELTNVDAAAANAGFVEGTKLSKTPELTFTLSGAYTFELANESELTVRADYAWTDDFFHQRNEDPLSLQESYGLLNTRVTWTNGKGNVELAGFVTNLTDEQFFNTILVGSTRIATGYPARGRQWGVSTKFRF